MVADACQLPVIAGLVEAASWGTVMSQAQAQAQALCAVSGSLAEHRPQIERSVNPTTYAVSGTEVDWQRAEPLLPGARG